MPMCEKHAQPPPAASHPRDQGVTPQLAGRCVITVAGMAQATIEDRDVLTVIFEFDIEPEQ